jgi:opacity protein-like surface antigen
MKKWILVLLTFMNAPFCHAEMKAGSQTLSLFGGGAQWYYEHDGAYYSYGKHGGSVGGQYMYYFTDAPMFGIGVDVMSTGTQNHGTGFIGTRLMDFASVNSDWRTTTYELLGKLMYPRGHLRPYIFGGLGGYTNHSSEELLPMDAWSDTRTTEKRFRNSDNAGVALSYGIGLDWYLNEAFFLGAEYRYNYAIGHVDPDGSGHEWDTALLRAGFRFGR